MFVSLHTAQKEGEFWGKGILFPGVFLMDKKGWRRKMKILQQSEVEMELKK
jgi:hypothetical protein